MTTTAQILREAAADVRVRGVCRPPRGGEICARSALLRYEGLSGAAQTALARSAGIDLVPGSERIHMVATWNDSQVSRAVVASEMESAADLAELMEGRGGLA